MTGQVTVWLAAQKPPKPGDEVIVSTAKPDGEFRVLYELHPAVDDLVPTDDDGVFRLSWDAATAHPYQETAL